jgi:hypothetical protein
MRLACLSFLLCLAGFLAAPGVCARQAAVGASPYSVVVPVADTSDGQRDGAIGTALAQVLARLAGGQDLRTRPGYAEALKGASGLVQQYQYQRSGNALALQVVFDPDAVRRTLEQLGVGAVAAKPPVLAVVYGADGQPLGAEALQPLAQALSARGSTLLTADPAALPDPARLAAADPAALAAVGERYHTGLILIGHLKGARAEWTLVSGGQPQQWSSQAASQTALLAEAGNALADHLGSRLNVIGSAPSNVTLWVGGLDSALDYAGFLAMLRANPAVRQIATTTASEQGMLFSLQTSVPAPGFVAGLTLGGRLIQAQDHAGADAGLRWLH